MNDLETIHLTSPVHFLHDNSSKKSSKEISRVTSSVESFLWPMFPDLAKMIGISDWHWIGGIAPCLFDEGSFELFQ